MHSTRCGFGKPLAGASDGWNRSEGFSIRSTRWAIGMCCTGRKDSRSTSSSFLLELRRAIRTVLERLSAVRVGSFLSVLKCFGPGGSGHLSFPKEGWTLALDIPLGSSGLAEVLDSLDCVVAEAGGRVYLSKDGRLRPELLASMYPRVTQWRAIRARLDPEGALSSDLGRRLGLSGCRPRAFGDVA